MAPYTSIFPLLLLTFLGLASTRELSRSPRASDRVRFIVEPEEETYWILKKQPAKIVCAAENAGEIIFTCGGVQIPPSSVEVEEDPDDAFNVLRAKIEVSNDDLRYAKKVRKVYSFRCVCSALNLDGQHEVKSPRKALVKQAKMKHKFKGHPQDISTVEGEMVEMQCKSPDANPKPEILWRKDDKRVNVDADANLMLKDDGTLVIKSAEETDIGTYQCVAKNIAGRKTSKSAELSVAIFTEGSTSSFMGSTEAKNRTPRQSATSTNVYFTETPKDVYYVKPGGDVKINCGMINADIMKFKCGGSRMENDFYTEEKSRNDDGKKEIVGTLTLPYSKVKDWHARNGMNQDYMCSCVAWYQDERTWVSMGSGSTDEDEKTGVVILSFIDAAFQQEPEDTRVGVDQEARLYCEPPKGKPQPWVHWYKNNQKLELRSSQNMFIEAPGNLVFRRVSYEDAGVYKCVAGNLVDEMDSQRVRLVVQDEAPSEAPTTTTTTMDPREAVKTFPSVIPDEPMFVQDFEDTEIEPGSTVTMTCSVVSAGQVTINCGGRRIEEEQYKEREEKVDEESGKKLNWGSYELDAQTVLDNEPREYRCYCVAWFLKEVGVEKKREWENIRGNNALITVVETVTMEKAFLESNFKRGPRDQTVEYGDEVEFTCVPPMGEPMPKVTWMKDGVMIDADNDDSIEIDSELLLIEEVTEANQGMYRCVATNEAGREVSKEAMLTVVMQDGGAMSGDCTAEKIQACLKDPSAMSDPEDLQKSCKMMEETKDCVMQIVQDCPQLASIGQEMSKTFVHMAKECGGGQEGGNCGMVRVGQCASKEGMEKLMMEMQSGDMKVIKESSCPTIAEMLACFEQILDECPQLTENVSEMSQGFQAFQPICNAEGVAPTGTDGEYTDGYDYNTFGNYGTDGTEYPDVAGDFPIFTTMPKRENFILYGSPVTLKCDVFYATRMDFECNGKTVEESVKTAQTIQHPDGTRTVSNELDITQEMLKAWKQPTPYTCRCNAYSQDDDGKLTVESSDNGTIEIAYLDDQFEMEPVNQQVMYGQEVTLRCKAPAGIPRPVIEWQRDSFLVGENSRIEITDSGSLMIKDFSAQDQGQYVCIAKSIAGQKSSDQAMVMLEEVDESMIVPDGGSNEEGGYVEPTVDAEVDMAIPGTPYISKELHHLYYLVKNKPTTLTCEAYNVNTIKIMCGDAMEMFMIDGIVIEEKSETYHKSDGTVAFQNVVTGTVTIRKNKLSSKNYNSDEYYCQCIGEYTVAGDKMMKKEGIMAVIEEAKLKDFTSSPMNQFPKEGQSVTIQCEIPEGNPVPEITFYKDDEMVTSDNSHTIIMGSTLMITMATMQDSGNYKCMAENVAGTRETAAALIAVEEGDAVEVDVEITEDVEPTEDVEEAATGEPYIETGCNAALVTECTGFASNTDPSKFCMFAEELKGCVSDCEENDALLPMMRQMYESVENNCKMVSGEDTMTVITKGEAMCPQVEECRKLYSNNLDANDGSSEYKKMCSNQPFEFVNCVDDALYECEMPRAAAPLPGASDSGEWFTSYCEYFFTESSSFEGCDAINSCNLPMNLNVADNNTFWCSMYNSVMECTEDAIDSCGLNALKAHLELMDEMTGTQYGCEIENMEEEDMDTDSHPEPSTTPEGEIDEGSQPDMSKQPEVVEEPGSAATKDEDDMSGASSISAALLLATCMQIILATLLSWR